MEENTKFVYKQLPSEIKTILINSDGWLVGSAIRKIIAGEDIRDYDIIVPVLNWHKTIINLRQYSFELNTFGGMKFTINSIEVDIWPDTLENFLDKSIRNSYIYNINKQLLLEVKQ